MTSAFIIYILYLLGLFLSNIKLCLIIWNICVCQTKKKKKNRSRAIAFSQQDIVVLKKESKHKF